jgi:hypothetical protein
MEVTQLREEATEEASLAASSVLQGGACASVASRAAADANCWAGNGGGST